MIQLAIGKGMQLNSGQKTEIKAVAGADVTNLEIGTEYFPKNESHDNSRILDVIEAQKFILL